jgi:hypothetical protein
MESFITVLRFMAYEKENNEILKRSHTCIFRIMDESSRLGHAIA